VSTRQLPHDPLELSIRARRGELSESERRALERGLEASAVAGVAHRIGRDFDAALRVRPGDEALLERVSRVAVRRALTPPRRPRPHPALLGLAAALVLGSAGATVSGLWRPAAGALVHWLGERDPVKPDRSAPSLAARGAARPVLTRPVATSAPTAVIAAPAPLTSAAAEPSVVARAPFPAVAPGKPSIGSSAGAPVTAVPPVPSAASLFHGASLARRAGNLASAKALYAELEASFPGSEEARVSRVSLGKLLLSGGDAAGAERQFARYLVDGGGALAEEALVGRAQSLARLGEATEERRVWLELLARFGTGVYAARAKARLVELAAPAR
jgi:hypothetical protein